MKKFTESLGSKTKTTWRQFLKMIEDDEIQLVNYNKEEVINQISNKIEFNKTRNGFDLLDIEVGRNTPQDRIRDGISQFDDFVIVYDPTTIDIDNTPIAIIGEYELSNPFVFGDIVICPGHDSVTVYNKETKEHKKGYIR